MDCVDCHNRPTHIYWAPEKAMDEALLRDGVSADLPFVRREGVRLLQEEYGSKEEALEGISAGIEDFYATSYPEIAAARASDIVEAGRVMGLLWATNVFPEMNLTWGTYPQHLGHPGFRGGCLRCHSGAMTTEGGESISQDCSLCHEVLAMDRPADEVRLQTTASD